VGVDIFFVISGFLISGILFREAAGPGVSLADFYVRRIRRIVPALSVVLVAVGAFGGVALPKLPYPALPKHVPAGAGFVSTFVLWNESGYFDAPTRFKPLVHLWSLGIEEQFYLFWPPLVLVCSRRGLSLASAAIGIVVVSFVLNVAIVRASPVT